MDDIEDDEIAENVDGDLGAAGSVDGADVEPKTAQGSRGWRIAAAVAVLAATLTVGALGSLLLGGSSGDGPEGDVLACVPSRDFTEDADKSTGDSCPPKDAKFTDGLVEKAKDGEFTLRVIEGGQIGTSIKLFVREPDRAYLDVQHAQTHAALGQPVRVYTKRHEGREIVIYMVDSPLLS